MQKLKGLVCLVVLGVSSLQAADVNVAGMRNDLVMRLKSVCIICNGGKAAYVNSSILRRLKRLGGESVGRVQLEVLCNVMLKKFSHAHQQIQTMFDHYNGLGDEERQKLSAGDYDLMLNLGAAQLALKIQQGHVMKTLTLLAQSPANVQQSLPAVNQ